MNERIKALAVEAGLSIRGHYDESGSTPAELQKFAELVIDEFAGLVIDDWHEVKECYLNRTNFGEKQCHLNHTPQTRTKWCTLTGNTNYQSLGSG